MPGNEQERNSGPRELTSDEIDRLFETVITSKARSGAAQSLQAQLTAHAAVIGSFTPHELAMGLAPSGDFDDALAHVLDSSVVVTQGRQRRWMLEPEARSAALAALGPKAAGVLQSLKFIPEDPLSEMLAGLLSDQPPDPDDLPTASLRTLVNAAEWCAPASPVASRMLPAWRHALEKRELVDPFRSLVGSHFVGREREIKALRDYVDVVPPSGLFDGWSRWLSNALRLGAHTPFLVYGVGGIGKSTLMAQFIVEHAAVAGERAFPFVYLDFDRALIDPMNVLTLVSEASRQLGAQFPEAADRLQVLRNSLRDGIEASRVEQKSRSSLMQSTSQVTDQRLVAKVSSNLVEFMHSAGLADRPFLLVLDTFEEVQARGDPAVDAVFAWLKAMSALRSLRTVIAGRAPVPDQKIAKTQKLGNLDRGSALAFLAREMLPPDLAGEVFQLVGGNPLSLQLAVRLLRKDDGTAVAWSSGDKEALRERLDDLQIQGYLYTRLLKHIRDARVQKLAHPGLILRRITPDIIEKVLAPVVDLKVTSAEDAEMLYAALRMEVSLVTEDGDALVHRKDVRAVMLPLQRANDRKLFERLNDEAARYYRGRSAPQDRVELAYHELMLGRDPYEALAGAPMALVRGLGSAIDELPSAASLALRLSLSRSLTKTEVRKLSDEAWEMYAFHKAMQLIGDSAPDDALKLLGERETLQKSNLLSYPRALALFHTLDWEAADAALEIAANYRRRGARQLPNEILENQDLEVRPLVERGYVQWYLHLDEDAAKVFVQARELAARRPHRMLRIESLLGYLAVAGSGVRAHSARTQSSLHSELYEQTGEVSMDEWRINLSTLRRLVFLGFADDATATAALQQLGLRLRSSEQIGEFLSEFAEDLDPGLQKKFARYAAGDGPTGTEQRLARSSDLAALERDAASYLSRVRKGSALRMVPFLRGRFAPWRVPLRNAVLSMLAKPDQVVPFLMEAFPEIYRAMDADPISDIQTLIDNAIEAAEDEDLVLDLLSTCIDNADEEIETGRPQMLLRALERYTGAAEGPASPARSSSRKPRPVRRARFKK